MVGWMDDEALHRTLTTGRCTYWSRSRQEYWVKGDTSGHQQWVKSVALDCDGDTVLVRSTRSARPATPATGPVSTPTCCPSWSADRPPAVRGRLPRDRPGHARSRRIQPAGGASAGRPGHPPAAGRRRDPGRRLPQARRRPRHVSCSSPPSTAERGLATPSSGYARAATLTERNGEAVWLGTPPPGVPSGGNPLDVLRGGRARACRSTVTRTPAAAGRAGRLPELRPRPPHRTAAQPGSRRAGTAGAADDAVHRPRGARPLRRLVPAGRQRLRRPGDHRRGRPRGPVRRRRAPPRPDDRGADGTCRGHHRHHRDRRHAGVQLTDGAGGLPEVRPSGDRRDQGRRSVPGRRQPAVRGEHHRRSARRLPGAPHVQPQSVHVPAALRQTTTSSARRRRRTSP